MKNKFAILLTIAIAASTAGCPDMFMTEWSYKSEADSTSDKPKVTVKSPSHQDSWITYICEADHEFVQFYFWDNFLERDVKTLQVRWDGGMPQSLKVDGTSTADFIGIPWPGAEKFLAKLSTSSELLISHVPFHEAPFDYTYSVVGAADAIRRARQECGLNQQIE